MIRWLFGTLAVIAVLYIGYSWYANARACDQACLVAGQGDGELRLHGGTRVTWGSHCECVNNER